MNQEDIYEVIKPLMKLVSCLKPSEETKYIYSNIAWLINNLLNTKEVVNKHEKNRNLRL